MLRQKKRRLEPMRKIGARMKKAKSEVNAIEINEPANVMTTEEKSPEPTTNATIRAPERIPTSTFSSPEGEESQSDGNKNG